MTAAPEKVKRYNLFRFIKAVRESRLNCKATALANALALRASFRSGIWRTSQTALCADTKMSKSSVYRAAQDLKRGGFVDIVNRVSNGGKDWREYRLKIPETQDEKPHDRSVRPISTPSGSNTCSARKQG